MKPTTSAILIMYWTNQCLMLLQILYSLSLLPVLVTQYCWDLLPEYCPDHWFRPTVLTSSDAGAGASHSDLTNTDVVTSDQ